MFPPAAPKDLRAVAEEGAVSLVWDPNTEADLGGYLVLRGEVAAGGTLQPLTPQPIKDATLPRHHRHAGCALRLRGRRRRHGAASANSSPPSPQSDGAMTARADDSRLTTGGEPTAVSIQSEDGSVK